VTAETIVRPVEQWGFKIERQVGGEAVSRVIVADRRMRIGCARVRMGGIGGVWTEPAHRKQGHMRAVMDRTMEFMRDQGFEVSLLFGIMEFYPRWGYATMIPEQRLTLRTESALRAASELRVRAYRRGEMPKLERIYNSVNALRTCSIVRPIFPAGKPVRASSPIEPPRLPEDSLRMGTRFFTTVTIFVVEDERGRIIGYGAYDREHVDRDSGVRTPIENEVAVAEVAATQERAYDAILGHLGRLAARRKVEQIVAFVPVDGRFALHCRSYGAEQQVSTRADGGAMMRIINLEQLMSEIEPELSRRVAGRGLSGKLALVTDLGAVGVRVSNRGARVVSSRKGADAVLELEQWKLLQLLVGYRGLEEVMGDPREVAFGPARQGARRRRVPERLRELGEALFPAQWPFCWRPDWF
jgi:GNAT superfamily N-acetyltransferase